MWNGTKAIVDTNEHHIEASSSTKRSRKIKIPTRACSVYDVITFGANRIDHAIIQLFRLQLQPILKLITTAAASITGSLLFLHLMLFHVPVKQC